MATTTTTTTTTTGTVEVASSTLPKDQQDLRAKVIRTAYLDIIRIRDEVAHEAAQLHRVYYKSKAQHRSAKWFQTLDALRKCYRRLLHSPATRDNGDDGSDNDQQFGASMMHDVGRAQYTHDVQVDGSLPNRAGRTERWRMTMRDQNSKHVPLNASALRAPTRDGLALAGSLEAVRLSLIAMWCSLWGENRDGRSNLPKYDRPPTLPVPSLCALEQCALNLFALVVLLEELSLRSQRAFSTLAAQLRTPPAPVFAPLVTILLPFAAVADRTAHRLQWGVANVECSAKDTVTYPLADLYNRVQRVATEQHAQPSTGGIQSISGGSCVDFVLDAKSLNNKDQWQRMLNMIQATVITSTHQSRRHNVAHTAFTSWLPSKLRKPATSSEKASGVVDAPRSEHPPDWPGRSITRSTYAGGGGGDEEEEEGEDVGEAI